MHALLEAFSISPTTRRRLSVDRKSIKMDRTVKVGDRVVQIIEEKEDT